MIEIVRNDDQDSQHSSIPSVKSDQILYPDVSLEEANEPLNLEIDEDDDNELDHDQPDDNDVDVTSGSGEMMVDKIDQLIYENHSILDNPLKIRISRTKKAFTFPKKEKSTAKAYSANVNDLNNIK